MTDKLVPVDVPPKPWLIPAEHSRFYWEAAHEQKLMIQRCDDCSTYIHPPMPICATCHSWNVTPQQISGKGTVYSFTVVRHLFHPGFADVMPYTLALVELAEQADLRVLTHIVQCDHEDISINMEVEVVFENRGNHSVPQFRPATSENDSNENGASS